MDEFSELAPDIDRNSRTSTVATVESAMSFGTMFSPVSYGKLTAWDVAYALNIGVACLSTYWIITCLLAGFVNRDSVFLGGMWAVVAVVFVFRDTGDDALHAGVARLLATCVSFALCLLYLLTFPFTLAGLAVLLGIGTLVMAALGRRDDIATTGITTTVVMVVAAISPQEAWQQPVLRLIDTVVGIGLGISFKWIGSYLFCLGNGWRLRRGLQPRSLESTDSARENQNA